jgi:hypothetical protein
VVRIVTHQPRILSRVWLTSAWMPMVPTITWLDCTAMTPCGFVRPGCADRSLTPVQPVGSGTHSGLMDADLMKLQYADTSSECLLLTGGQFEGRSNLSATVSSRSPLRGRMSSFEVREGAVP